MDKVVIHTIEKSLSKIEEVNKIIFDNILRSQKTSATTLFLEGNLGAGKTTLTQVIGRTLGVTKPLTSPTYTIMNEYQANHDMFTKVTHMDLYRIETLWELQEYNLETALLDPKTLFIIEWSKTAKDFFANTHCYQVDITGINQQSRTYTISKLEQNN